MEHAERICALYLAIQGDDCDLSLSAALQVVHLVVRDTCWVHELAQAWKLLPFHPFC